MVDSMQSMFDYQKQFGSRFRDYDNPEPEEFGRLILCLYEEISELQSMIPWKPYRSFQKEDTKSNKLEGVVDILKYLIELSLYLGLTWDEIQKMFYTKSSVCEYRYKQEFLTKFDNIALVDIDGVLTNYPQGFLQELDLLLPDCYDLDRSFCTTRLKMFEISNEIGVTYKDLREAKHHWRESGGYRRLSTRYDWVTSDLKKLGFQVVLLSNRPFHRYKRIWGDTLEWLVKHGIEFDGLMFAEDEKIDIFEIFDIDKIKLVVEDDPSQIIKYCEGGLKVLVPEYPYNTETRVSGVDLFSRRDTFINLVRKISDGK